MGQKRQGTLGRVAPSAARIDPQLNDGSCPKGNVESSGRDADHKSRWASDGWPLQGISAPYWDRPGKVPGSSHRILKMKTWEGRVVSMSVTPKSKGP